MNLILSSNQGLALLRQKQILRSNRHKNLQRQNNEDFFIQLLNAWLHFTNNNFHTPAPIDEILDQPKFLTNQHLTNTPNWTLALTTNPYFYFIPSRIISDIQLKFTIITTFYLLYDIWPFSKNTSGRLLLNKGTKKVKDLQKLSYKEIYFILHSNSTK